MKQAYRKDIDIQPDEVVVIDRSLDDSRFRAATGFVAPAWPAMIEEMAASPLPYDDWKNRE